MLSTRPSLLVMAATLIAGCSDPAGESGANGAAGTYDLVLIGGIATIPMVSTPQFGCERNGVYDPAAILEHELTHATYVLSADQGVTYDMSERKRCRLQSDTGVPWQVRAVADAGFYRQSGNRVVFYATRQERDAGVSSSEGLLEGRDLVFGSGYGELRFRRR
jgi:hypothetical protein